ncbi:VCBS repeat-containing protein [Psychromarinibacter sp. C21-152]|uniref:VCBS repeat-containing protein n=1 Tax=Psychromarinibacter sediminicola TaxID=3033385 RepID=A0AAE3T759_9RHOB|nr:VCBS repeat-containing protein [Psychromarinibacter sediminicola]MDF0599977.1 VCBS repeat-containing protein [Psychromarinibacter sediminicola]
MRAAAAFALCLLAVRAAACEISPADETAYPGSVVTDAETRGAIARAWFDAPVARYRHFVLSRDSEPEALWVDAPGNHGNCGHRIVLDDAHVFEDVAPRLVDLDGDGTNEVIVVRSHAGQGAQLAVYRWTGRDLVLDAATPYIGRPHRWLAPVGAADLDGDGAMELAYVDRPHLARILRVWRYAPGRLTEVAAARGLSNHRIGESAITGGVRDCGAGPEMVTADAAWEHVIVTRLEAGRLVSRRAGPFDGAGSVGAVMACKTR